MNASIKGWYHSALVVTAVAEAFSAKTNLRRALLGGCAGWHLWAVYEHFVREPKEKTELMFEKIDLDEFAKRIPEPGFGMFSLERDQAQVKHNNLAEERLKRDRRNTWGNHDD